MGADAGGTIQRGACALKVGKVRQEVSDLNDIAAPESTLRQESVDPSHGNGHLVLDAMRNGAGCLLRRLTCDVDKRTRVTDVLVDKHQQLRLATRTSTDECARTAAYLVGAAASGRQIRQVR